MAGIEHRRDGSVRLGTTGDHYLLRAGGGSPVVALGDGVDVVPVGDSFKLTSPYVEGVAHVGPNAVVSGDFGTLNLRDEVARLSGHPRGGVDSATADVDFWRRRPVGGSRA